MEVSGARTDGCQKCLKTFPKKVSFKKFSPTTRTTQPLITQGIMRHPGRNNLQVLLLPALLLLLAMPGQLPAESADPHQHHGPASKETPPPIHEHPAAPSIVPDTQVGLDERLGQHIPLDITFRDETGQPVVLKELIQGPTIIAPIYYGCPNVCNFLQGGLAMVLGDVALKPMEQYRILSISFDETETPAQAAQSKRNYLGAIRGEFPPQAWSFLTGDEPQIRRFTDAIGFQFQRQGVDFLHPVAVVVVAGDGQIIRYLHGTRFLAMDVTLALVEASEGRVGATIRRVASFCFDYDPENRRYVFNLLRVSGTVIFLSAGGFLAFLLLSGRKKKG
jgi:protein SCO1